MIVVIPHHSGPVEAARTACHPHPVLVVDDRPGGADLSGDVLTTSGEEGFARAANRGIEEAERRGHELVLLLNDDAQPAAGCIDRLVGAMQPDVALVGPVLRGPHGVESAGIRFDPRTGRLTQRTEIPDGPTDVDALSGACLLVRSTVRFDEAFPHAMEDVELARRLPGRAVLVPDAVCHHLGGASVSRTSRRATRDALAGHMRLVDSPAKRGLVTGYAVLQVLREGNRRRRLLGVLDAWAAVPED